MTRPPEIQLERSAVAAQRGRRLLPPARYRHPGDIIRLITAGFVLIGASAVTAATQGTYAGASAVVVTAVAPSTTAGRMLAGLVQTVFIAAAGVAVVVTLRSGRYRLLAGLAGSAVLASATVTGIIYLAGGERPRAGLARNRGSYRRLLQSGRLQRRRNQRGLRHVRHGGRGSIRESSGDSADHPARAPAGSVGNTGTGQRIADRRR